MTHLALIACSIFAQVPAQEPASSSPRVHKIAVGGEGGWDYLTVDPDARRLYVSRQASHGVVIDLGKEAVVGELADHAQGPWHRGRPGGWARASPAMAATAARDDLRLRVLEGNRARSRRGASPTRSSTARPATGSSPSITARTTAP